MIGADKLINYLSYLQKVDSANKFTVVYEDRIVGELEITVDEFL